MRFIPLRNIKLNELENDYFWIIDKISFVLNSNEYNDFAVNFCRKILHDLDRYKCITPKQAKFIKDLKSNKQFYQTK